MKPRRRRFTGVLAVVSVAVFACTSARVESERIGARSDRIQGGVAESGSSFAVAVFESGGGICSGTLIAPNLVLTARHCVADDDGGSFVRCSQDRFDAPRAASRFRVATQAVADFDVAAYRVTKVLVPTETLFCGNDIALLVLDQLVPAAAAVAAAPALDGPLSKHGTKLIAIGYGTSGPSENDEGTRRRRDNVTIECIPGDAALDCDPADYQMTAAELAAGSGLCEGDSGSGAFGSASIAAGKPVVMGVLSRASDDGVRCRDAVYVRTDTKAAFLVDGANEAAKAGGYALPAWAGGAGATETDAAAPIEPSEEPPPAADPGATTPTTTTTTASCAIARGGSGAAGPGIAIAMLALSFAFARRRRA
ncbi:MAG: trypsin-like serine protease [Labilithrix sp.]|nr:trypsin-like serine protease [Labilithrix sp.]